MTKKKKGRKHRHRYLFDMKGFKFQYGMDYACLDCGLNWNFDKSLRLVIPRDMSSMFRKRRTS
jgi:hypothetical protein